MATGADPRPAGHDIATGASVGFVVQLTSYAIGLGASILIARALGPAGRGDYYIPVATAIACQGILHLGLEMANTYLFAERHESLNRLMSNASAAALLISPLCFTLLALFFLGTRDSIFSGVSAVNFALAAATVPMQAHTIWMANIYALANRVVQTQLIAASAAILQCVAIAALYASGELTVRTVLCVYAGYVATGWAAHVYFARRFAPARPRVIPSLMRRVLAFGLKVHVGFIFWFLLLRSDVFFVKLQLGAREVGVYSLAVIFAEVAVLLTGPLVVAALPAQSRGAVQAAGEVTLRVVRFNLALALALCLFLVATLWVAFPALYGSGFSGAYPAFCVLVPGIVAMAAFRPLYNWLLRQGRPWLMSGLTFAAFAVNVALNLLLLPRVGIVGASIASSVAYVMLTGAFLSWARAATGTGLRQALGYSREDLEILRAAVARLARRLTAQREALQGRSA